MLRRGLTLIAVALMLTGVAGLQTIRTDTEDVDMAKTKTERNMLTHSRDEGTGTLNEAKAARDAANGAKNPRDEAMQVLVTGEGPRTVLVPGGLTGRVSWDSHAERLSRTRTVASVQLKSVQYGLEDRSLPAGYGIPTETAALERTLDELGWHEPVDVVAWSYGALVSLDFALGHPERIRTLTLIEPPAMWVLDDKGAGDPDVEAVRAFEPGDAVAAGDLEQFIRAVGIVGQHVDPRTLPQWEVWMKHRRSLRAVGRTLEFDGDPTRLAAFDRPVLLVTGTGTAPFHRRIHDILAERLPRAVAVEMPGGHAPHIISMDRFLADLQDFLEARYVTSKDGTSIGYVSRSSAGAHDERDRRAVLFVHGVTADRNSWSRVAPHLEGRLTVYAMDRRGRGLSGDAAAYDLAREAEDVAAVVDAIGQPVILFGHSFGGLCALEAALLTDNVERLILYEPAIPDGTPTFAEHDLRSIERSIARDELERAMDHFLREFAHLTDEEVEVYRQTPLWQARLPLVRTIPREVGVDESYVFDPSRFSDMNVPTTLLLGGESPQVYRDAVARLNGTLPQAEVVSLPGQQHVAHHAAPDLLARAMLKTLEE